MRASILFVLLSLSGLAAANSKPSYRRRQATRDTVVDRLLSRRFADLRPRDPTNSEDPDPPCWCDDEHTIACIDNCPGSCPPPETNTSESASSGPTTTTDASSASTTEPTTTYTVKKRSYPTSQAWIPVRDFDGTTLPPAHAKDFFLSEGHKFSHPTNGSLMRDHRFIAFSHDLRRRAAQTFSVHHLVRRASDLLINGGSGGALVKFGSSYLARWLSKELARGEQAGTDVHDLVLRLSEDFGIRATDVIPMVRLMLEDRQMKQVVVHYHVFSRQMLQHMIDTVCPRLGPKMCGEGLDE